MNPRFNLLIVSAVIFLISACSSKKDLQVLLTANWKEGNFSETISETGTLDAVSSADVTTPDIPRGFLLVYLIDEGATVKQGQKIAQFDTGEIDRDIQNSDDKIDDKKEEIETLLSKQKDELVIVSNNLDQLRDALDMEKINQRSLEFASDVDKRAGEIRYRGKETDLSNAAAKLKSTLQEHFRQRKARNAELRKLQEDRLNKIHDKELCTIYAPKSGLVVYRTKNPWVKDKIRIGDNLRRSQTFISIPDLDRMMVKLEINEVDVHRLTTGMKAKVVLDAVQDKEFTGVLKKIGSLAYGKPSNTDIMVFEGQVFINEMNVEVLRPGMTAKCTIEISKLDEARYLPIDAIFQSDGNKGRVYIFDGSKKIVKSEVRLGIKNDDFIVIETDLPQSTKFLLYHPDIEKNKDLDLSKFNIQDFFQKGKKSDASTNSSATNVDKPKKADKKPATAVTPIPVETTPAVSETKSDASPKKKWKPKASE
jgi:multidrug efflux pump subunit AcrA (membrane-fusion protein)